MGQEEKQPKSVGRAYLLAKLRERGVSRRRAKRVLNAVIEEIKQALQRGEEVEFPFGKLERVRHRHRQQEGEFLGEKRTIYRRRYTVEHVLDEKGDKCLNPPPPKPKPKPKLRLLPKPVRMAGR